MRKNYRRARIPYDRLLSALGISRENMNDMFYNIFFMSADSDYHKLRMENAKHVLFFYYTYGAEYTAKILGYENAADFRADFYGEFKITPEEFTALYH